jgi:hypothetical protein
LQAAVDAVEEPSFLLELLVVLREYPFSKEAESLLLSTWFERYPAHPLTLDTRARLLLEQVGVFPVSRRQSPCCSTPGLIAHPLTLDTRARLLLEQVSVFLLHRRRPPPFCRKKIIFSLSSKTFKQCFGSGFNQVSRSRFGIRIRIRIQEGKNYP